MRTEREQMEREQFEAWAKTKGFNCSTLTLGRFGARWREDLDLAFEAWCAAKEAAINGCFVVVMHYHEPDELVRDPDNALVFATRKQAEQRADAIRAAVGCQPKAVEVVPLKLATP